MDKKVSIITPCYNGEEYITRYLDSVLSQTYSNIELILVNDGSKDKTEEIIDSYKDQFQKRGIELKYIYQENGGQAVALNNGLKRFTGDYITWPDSDDMLTAESIEKKVRFLEDNDGCGLVRTDANIVDEKNTEVVIGRLSDGKKVGGIKNIFDDLITEDNIWFAPGCYLVDASAFEDVNPDREIYISRAGQNWQMLLPVSHKYSCGYIAEPLYTYVVRSSSHSHSVNGLKKELDRCNEHQDLIISTLDTIDMDQNEKKRYISLVEDKYKRKKFTLSLSYYDRESFKKYYSQLDREGLLDKKIKANYLRRFYIVELLYRGAYSAYKAVSKLKRR